MKQICVAVSLLLITGYAASRGAAGVALEAKAAAAVFAEAQKLSDADGGSMWGVPLYGPMLLVERETRKVMANVADAAGVLHPEGDVYAGVMPDSVGLANTSLSWAGREWTMVLWPLPEDEFARRGLIAHELWHRIQDQIGLPSRDPGSTHLTTYDGRLWLQFEWRALAAALRAEGAARETAVRDAIAFRTYRRETLDGSREAERQLELHEGLAEYTGVALCGRGVRENAEAAARHLDQAEDSATFIRSFAYASGPAYGLLLDAYDPQWRERLTPDSDLGDMLAGLVGGSGRRSLAENTDTAVRRYDGENLIARERRIADQRRARIAGYKKRYVEGPVLRLDFVRMNVTFDPGKVDALEGVGNIYASMKITDAWGVLTVTGGGLITVDWRAAVVPVPENRETEPIVGDGYTLELAPGWQLAPDETGFHIEKTTP